MRGGGTTRYDRRGGETLHHACRRRHVACTGYEVDGRTEGLDHEESDCTNIGQARRRFGGPKGFWEEASFESKNENQREKTVRHENQIVAGGGRVIRTAAPESG